MKLIGQTLLDGEAVHGTAVAVALRTGPTELVHYIKWGTGVSAGQVVVEGAGRIDDTAWAPLLTITFDGTAPKQDAPRTPGGHAVIRHRISQEVLGGTVVTKLEGHGAW